MHLDRHRERQRQNDRFNRHRASAIPSILHLPREPLQYCTSWSPKRCNASRFPPNSKRSLFSSRSIPFLTYTSPANKDQRDKIAYQKFSRQLYHASLSFVLQPLKKGMTKPVVMRCPDGHFRRCIYQLGPYIADYPEQVWLAAIVQNWCPK
jgi:hypothetical protein